MSFCTYSGQQLFAVRRDEQRQRDGTAETGAGAGGRVAESRTSDAVGYRQSGTKRQFVWETFREFSEYTNTHTHVINAYNVMCFKARYVMAPETLQHTTCFYKKKFLKKGI